MAGTGNTSIRSYNFFSNDPLVAGGYNANKRVFLDQDANVVFTSKVVMISNDGGTTLQYRFAPDRSGAGTDPAHGEVQANETITLEHKREKEIYLSGAGALAVRIWAH